MAVDIKKLFNEELPASLTKNAEDAKTIGAKYQMNITDEGEWSIDVSATGPSCVAGNGPGGKAKQSRFCAEGGRAVV
ncbi:MAG TPA: hypothetical protein PLR99_21215, partial [Polyangiaceae bacterium]|nr:hypothetical protein [Polyangiaceae bacterium]